MEVNVEKRHRTLMTLWFALLLSIGSYFVFSLIAPPEISSDARIESNSALIVALTVLALVLVGVSFLVKRKFLSRSIDRQDVVLVHKGYLFAWVLCDVSALLGLLESLVIGYRQYYLLFVLGAAAMALQFPRREHLLAASFKSINQTSF